jgi:hypothetical protein
MEIKYSDYTKQELRCLIARYGDTKKCLLKQLEEVNSNLKLMSEALKGVISE